MTIPPPQPAAPGKGRHATRKPARTLGITRIIASADLPEGINALAATDGRTVIVRSGLDKYSRRRAIRDVLAATHRFPGLALWPALADARIRRFIIQAVDSLAGSIQHAAMAVSPDNPALAIVASVAVVITGGSAVVGVATGVIPATPFTAAGPGSQSSPGAPPKPIYRHLAPNPASYLGAYEAGTPGSYAPVTAFSSAIGHRVNLALYYSGWGEPFQAGFARAALASHAWPVVQMNPDKNTSLKGIAQGDYDSYLTSFAMAVHSYGQNVVIGFGHEMNASWYRWGWNHVRPATFVLAWRHIVNVFQAMGDFNVTWLWTVNVDTPGKTGSLAAWYPGSYYVTWVGIDGYYFNAAGTFGTVFGPTLADVAGVAPGKHILISETAADPPEIPEVRQITGLFKGIRQQQILGFIWFDQIGRGGQDWRLESNPPALAAFKQAAKGYR
jgi:Glycosyl hydrolase family 26